MKVPPEVINEWARLCSCCGVCSGRPCDGVMAGGVCDDRCDCDEFDQEEFSDSEYDAGN